MTRWPTAQRLLVLHFIEPGIAYNMQGNITNLSRVWNNTLADSLVYSYTGNRLVSIIDKTTSATGLVAGTTNYNGSGNITSNANAANTGQNKSYSYNLLNLPQTVTITGGTVTYTYDASGNKLRKQSTTLGNTEYIGGIQYGATITGLPDFIQTEEGRAVPSGTTAYKYYYHLGDNLGNTRITFDSSTGAATTLQKDDYLPFGMEINWSVSSPKNEYLYNTKELQEELGQYDYGARFYDPVVARWNTLDPKAEKYFGFSLYNYTLNDPIANIDPNGKEVDVKIGGQNYKYNEQDGKLYDKKGDEYTGDNKFAAKALENLNKLNGTKIGKKILGELSTSESKFVLNDKKVGNRQGSSHNGAINIGSIMDSRYSDGANLETVAHELFHGYQELHGNDSNSINAETEAYLFGSAARKDAGFKLSGDGYFGAILTPEADSFDKSFNNLLSGSTFNQADFNDAVKNFKSGSAFNMTGIYNNQPVDNNYKVLIDKLYPLAQ